MQFNPQKCFVLRIAGSRSPFLSRGGNLSRFEVGHTHIVNITSSANKINGFIHRNLISCTKETKSAAYSTLARPILEYSSSVWDHIQKNTYINWAKYKEEQLQCRMVCNDYRQETSASELIRGLDWDMLSTRRKINRVNIMHKALGGTWHCRCLITCAQQAVIPDAQAQGNHSFSHQQEQTVTNTPSYQKQSRTGIHFHLTSRPLRITSYLSNKLQIIFATKTATSRTK